LRLVEGGGIGDALAPLFRRKSIDEEVRRADKPFVHRGSGLDCQQFVHQGFVNALAKLGQNFGQHKMLLPAVPLDDLNTTGVHDGKVGAQAVTDLFVRGAHLVFEQLQREQYSWRDGWTATGGVFGETLRKAPVDSRHECCPGKCISPLAEGMGFGYKISDLEARTVSG
jgi:hypothetical protein